MNKILEYLKQYDPKNVLDETPELISLLEEYKERQNISIWNNCDISGRSILSSDGVDYIDIFNELEYPFKDTNFFKEFPIFLKKMREILEANESRLDALYNILTIKYKINPDELFGAVVE